MERYAIVGFGCAGYNGAKALREHGFCGEIHVYSNIDSGPESPIMVTYYAGGIVARDACTPFGSLENIADNLGLTPHVAAVARINGKNKEIMTDAGIRGRFDKILIATGASPQIPPTKGNTAEFIVPGTIHMDRGIVVNVRMETSAEGIYAAGDCCRVCNTQAGRRTAFGLWASAGMQGRTAGKIMAGACSEHDGNVSHNITHFIDMDFAGSCGSSIPGERRTYMLDNGLMIELVAGDSHAGCINLLGDHKVCGIIKSMFLQRLRSGIFKPVMAQESMSKKQKCDG